MYHPVVETVGVKDEDLIAFASRIYPYDYVTPRLETRPEFLSEFSPSLIDGDIVFALPAP